MYSSVIAVVTSSCLWRRWPLVCCTASCVLFIAGLLSAQANTHSEPLGRLPEDERTRGSSVPPATFRFDKQMADPRPQGLVCEFTPMWFLYVCLPKIQIFIKTASMLECTMFSTPEQSFSSYMSKGTRRGTVAVRTGLSSISPCCRKTLCQKDLQGDEVCFGFYFRAQSVAVGKAWLGHMKPAHHTALTVGK